MDLGMLLVTGATLSCHLIYLVSSAVQTILPVRPNVRRPHEDACWVRLLTPFALSRLLIDIASAAKTVLREGMRRRVRRVDTLVLHPARFALSGTLVDLACITVMAVLLIMASQGRVPKLIRFIIALVWVC